MERDQETLQSTDQSGARVDGDDRAPREATVITTPDATVSVAAVHPSAPAGPLGHEEVARVHVEPEDRLAFRVGVNLLTLVLLGLAVYLVWRRYFAGG